jgi:general secretion pathway protein C
VLDSIVDKITSMEQQRISYYVLLAIVVVIAVAIGEQLYSAYYTKNYHSDVATSTIQQKPNRESLYDVEVINKSHLLGQFDTKINPQNSQKNLPTTNLKLTLRGAFTSSNPQHASAMIEGPDQKTSSYKVNGNVYGNTVLHSVFSNRVVLSRQGQLETLYFPAVSARQSQPSPQSYTLSNGEISKNRTKSSATMTKEQRQQLIKSRLQELRNRSRK